jgi:hypothetical protein
MAATLKQERILETLIYRGFDRSVIDEEDGGVLVKCGACSAIVVNGIAAHERGCPHRGSECRECGCYVPAGESCNCFDPAEDEA